ncbi:hypothetical protein A6D6_02277 [Alcanivorax xiamenensis]|uniref:Ribbon-helix-helix protein CopG domain-containing protein n=2 Tax=Alcanivoracaceae TaxID=224372 RepID=A0ABQ6Y7X7_9GAMM|nr:hypothetical protein A6D6_02277 [Alcanivorax xiamenensis]
MLFKHLHDGLKVNSCPSAVLCIILRASQPRQLFIMEQIDFVDQQQNLPTTPKRAPRMRRTGSVRAGHRRLTADIPADLHKRLKMQALREDRSVTDLIVHAAEYYLRKV